MYDCKSYKISLEVNFKIIINSKSTNLTNKLTESRGYRVFMYLMKHTRPDISFAESMLSLYSLVFAEKSASLSALS